MPALGCAAQRRAQHIQPLLSRLIQRGAAVHIMYVPFSLEPVGNPEAPADQTLRQLSKVHTYKDYLLPAPRSAQGGIPVPGFQPLIHIIGNLPQRQLAQGYQIPDPEKRFQRLCHLLGGINLAFPHPLLKHLRGDINQLNLPCHS
ncbi:hypothetical protein D3C80_1799370 [compost metagenome]